MVEEGNRHLFAGIPPFVLFLAVAVPHSMECLRFHLLLLLLLLLLT